MAPEIRDSWYYTGTEDFYSLGITMYMLLTGGKWPYSSPDQRGQEARGPEDHIETLFLHEGLVRIIETATAYSPIDRYPTAQAFAAALRGFIFSHLQLIMEEIPAYRQGQPQNGYWHESTHPTMGTAGPKDPTFFEGSDFTSCSAVIIAAGITREKLYPGEGEFLGRGVSYCATCDGMLYRGKTVAVIGNGEEAAHDADFLESIGCTVLRMTKQLRYEIRGGMKADTLVAGDAEHKVDGIFIIKCIYASETGIGNRFYHTLCGILEQIFALYLPIYLITAFSLTEQPCHDSYLIKQELLTGQSAAVMVLVHSLFPPCMQPEL